MSDKQGNKIVTIAFRISKQNDEIISKWAKKHGFKKGPFCLFVVMEKVIQLENLYPNETDNTAGE